MDNQRVNISDFSCSGCEHLLDVWDQFFGGNPPEGHTHRWACREHLNESGFYNSILNPKVWVCTEHTDYKLLIRELDQPIAEEHPESWLRK